MKTYEFQVESHNGPVGVVVTLDGNGDFASIDYVGYDPEYDQTVSALCGKESEVSVLVDMIELEESKKVDITYGFNYRSREIPEKTRVILALTMKASDRLHVVSVISRREYHGYIRRFSDENTIQLVLSLTDQNLILKAILDDDYMKYDAMLKIFKNLDTEHRYDFIDRVKTTRLHVDQTVELVSNENEKFRRRMAYKIARNIKGFWPHGNTIAVIGHVVDLAETMQNDRNRANTVVDILIHAGDKVTPSLAKRIGNVLLGIDPIILRDIKDKIITHPSSFEPATYRKLLSITR